jgi:Icc-related predicted phosphoesterase
MERLILPPRTADSPRRISARVAAVGDLHIRGAHDRRAILGLDNLSERADLLVLTGDLTDNGRLVEAEAAADHFAAVRIPIVAVLGNHDHRSLRRTAFRKVFERKGIEILEGRATIIRVAGGGLVGVAGTTGSGGGFWTTEWPDGLHTRTFERLAIRARREGEALAQALAAVDADIAIAVTLFAPTTATLGREPQATFWMLVAAALGLVIDRYRPDLVLHGHAHLGALRGRMAGGSPVLNVALPVAGGVHIETVEGRGTVPEGRSHPETLTWR